MTEQATGLPPGMALCPGWTSEYGRERYGKDIVAECGKDSFGRRRSDPAVVRAISGAPVPMCSRCRRQKSKWDEENGQRDKLEKQRAEQYASLIGAYVVDVQNAIPAGAKFPDSLSFLTAVVTAVDGLEQRAQFPPHPRMSEGGSRYTINDVLSPPQKMDILRVLAQLPIAKDFRRGY